MKKADDNKIISSEQAKKVSQLENAIKSGQFQKIEKSQGQENIEQKSFSSSSSSDDEEEADEIVQPLDKTKKMLQKQLSEKTTLDAAKGKANSAKGK